MSEWVSDIVHCWVYLELRPATHKNIESNQAGSWREENDPTFVAVNAIPKFYKKAVSEQELSVFF